MKRKLASMMTLTLDEVCRMHRCGRIDSRTLRAFTRVHGWCGPRFGGLAGDAQDAFHARYGRQALQRRIDRTRTAFGFAPLYA